MNLGSGPRASGWVELTSGSGGGSSLLSAVSAAHHKSRPPRPPRFGRAKVKAAGSDPFLHLKLLRLILELETLVVKVREASVPIPESGYQCWIKMSASVELETLYVKFGMYFYQYWY